MKILIKHVHKAKHADNISDELIIMINWDQTGVNIVPGSDQTFRGAKQVTISGNFDGWRRAPTTSDLWWKDRS